MTSINTRLIKYSILALVAAIAVWQLAAGNSSFGLGLLIGVIMAAGAVEIKHGRISKMQEKGMNPYDERAWSLAGMAAYGTVRIFSITIAIVVLVGSIWGPQVQVNPYNLLGVCLCALLVLYVISYYYYNRKF